MKYYVVDAFADKVFEGNPAGVCVLKEWIADDLMQKIACENNLSETAFTVKEGDCYKLRWFTPGGEIDLCGHATLGTAFVLASFYDTETSEFRFNTLSGQLLVTKKDDLFEMDFPSRMPEPTELTQEMIDALGKPIKSAYLSRDLMLVLENEDDVINATPDFSMIKNIPQGLGFLITAPSKNGRDFVCRTFFPKLNVNEDPVCGSAHCNFIPYWANCLGKDILISRQVSSRGGTVYCRNAGERVYMAGRAVLYSEAELFI